MRRNSAPMLLAVLASLVFICGSGASYSQDNGQLTAVTQNPSPADQSAQAARVNPGQKMTLEGVIVNRQPDGITLRDYRGGIYTVKFNNSTEVKERKTNPFRRAKGYSMTNLLPGLEVEAKGAGDPSGSLMAREIRFRGTDFRVANSLETRVHPVEDQLSATQNRLSQSEQNAQRLSGQVQELSAVSNAARGGAKAAQETADNALSSANNAQSTANTAQAGVQKTNERVSNLVTSLDDYDVRNSATVLFKLGSAVLTKEAKADLDKIAEDAKAEKGFLIEVAGFASSDGSTTVNERLSQNRADAVIHYLAQTHGIPLRRFVTPLGYGEAQPAADNSTRNGRVQNRRVEVKILVNKGLNEQPTTSTSQVSDLNVR